MANQHNFPLIGQAFLGTKILSASASLAGTDSGKGFSNASATGAITVTLPQAKPGYQFQFLVVVAQNIVVTPQSTDNIRGSAVGVATTLTTIGSLLYLECINAGTWEIVAANVSGGFPVSSIVGTANQIAVSVAAGVATLSLTPNITLNGTGSGSLFTYTDATFVGYRTVSGTATGDFLSISGTGVVIRSTTNVNLLLGANANVWGTLTPAGSWLLAAPLTGNNTLTINSVAGQSAIVLSQGGLNGTGGLLQEALAVPTLIMNSSGPHFGQIGDAGSQVWYLGHGASPTANGASCLQWTTAPLVQIMGAGASSTTSTFAGANRAVLQLNSISDQLLDFSTSGACNGYIYASTGELRLNTPFFANPITFWTNNVQKWAVGGSGSFFAAAAGAGDPGVSGVINCAGLQINGAPVSAITKVTKSAGTGRSTTTSTADPDLSVSLGVGRYAFKAYLSTTGTAGNGGFKYGFNNASGTMTMGYYELAIVNGSVVTPASAQAASSAAYAFAAVSTSTTADAIVVTGFVSVTVAGVFQLQWAQNTAAGTTTLQLGSWLEVV